MSVSEQSENASPDDSCYHSSGNRMPPLSSAIIHEDFDRIRQMTGYTDEDPEELIFKVTMNVGDMTFRKEHKISDADAFEIWDSGVLLLISSNYAKADIVCENAKNVKFNNK